MPEGGLHCRIGFDNLAKNEEPRLFIMLQVNPEKDYGFNRMQRARWIEIMKDIQVNRNDWVGWELDNPREYSLISKNRNLRELLPSEEIEEDCKAVLQVFLDELVEIKHSYPEIPWMVLGDD